MRLLYRADGGHPIGTGHVYRAVRILQRLSEMCELQATLVISDTPSARAISEAAPAEVLNVPPSFGPDSVKPRFRFDSVENLVIDPSCDVIAVDMLDTARSDMERLEGINSRVVTFDDRGDGRLCADGIINVLVAELASESLPSKVRLFQGPDYAVLDPIYAESKGAYRFRSGPIERVFVTLGGGDAAGLTVKVARALKLVNGVRRVEFGVGPAFPHNSDLKSVTESAPWEAEVHINLSNLKDRYLSADLSIVAGGLTMYEVCCVGAPSLAVCQPIDHQVELAASLSEAGAMASVGYGLQASEEEIANRIAELSLDDVARESMSIAGPRLVDGKGTERVARILMELGSGNE